MRETATSLAVPLATAVAALALGAWNLGRPALWLDETASTAAIRRSWPHLWLMLQGSDAPLVPYYAVLKCLARAPAGHLEVMVRWPSVAATALAVLLLTRWLQRVASTSVAVTAAAFLLLTVGVSRYAQEARPYAMVLCLAVAATVAWWRAVVEGRRRAVPVYVVAIAGLAFLHVMALLLIPVHVIAAAVIGGRRRIVTTVLGSLAGAALVSPFTILAVLHGQGATRFAGLSPLDLVTAIGSLFGSGTAGGLFAVPLLVLSVLALRQWNSPQVRLAAVWAVVPPLIFVGAVILRPNLLIPRYLLFTLPAWAILAATGLVAVAGAVARVLPVLVLAALALLQWPALSAVRAAGGHGEDLRPSIAAAESAPYRRLAIYVGPAHDGVEVQAYAPLAARRLVNTRVQTDQPPVWPDRLTVAEYRAAIRSQRALIVLIRHGTVLPHSLAHRGFRVARALPHGRGWTAYLAIRR